jgi:hypothetical protein
MQQRIRKFVEHTPYPIGIAPLVVVPGNKLQKTPRRQIFCFKKAWQLHLDYAVLNERDTATMQLYDMAR